MQEASHRVARALAGIGVEDNGVVGIYSPNRSRIFEIVLGVLRRGPAWNPINATNVPESNIDLLLRAGTSVVFVDEKYHHLVDGLREGAPDITTVSMGDRGACDLGWDEFNDHGIDFPTWETAQGNPERTVMIVGTGGTTGKPKLVVQSVPCAYGMRSGGQPRKSSRAAQGPNTS